MWQAFLQNVVVCSFFSPVPPDKPSPWLLLCSAVHEEQKLLHYFNTHSVERYDAVITGFHGVRQKLS
jgi:hypothetical protein